MNFYYTLSFSHRITKGDDSIHYYKWVRVGAAQIKPETTRYVQQPMHLRPGEVYEFTVEGTGSILGYVEQDWTIRTLTSAEKEAYYAAQRSDSD